MKRLVCVIFLEISLFQFLAAQKICPVDESWKDKTFSEFRTRLLQALDTRDTNFLLGILYSKVEMFGERVGVEDFKHSWLDRPQSKIWYELTKILRLGGKFKQFGKEKAFIVPYYRAERIGGYADGVVTAKNVRVRSDASRKSNVIEILSCDLVTLCNYGEIIVDSTSNPPEEWVNIYTPKRQYGYISSQYIGSAIGTGACFVKKGKEWKLTWMGGGD
jgi:hypothetical protein